MITGPDLLAKVKELGDVSKSELVRECGYLSTKKDGSERLNFTAFYEALLNAKVMLHLWVKVRQGWTNDNRLLRRFGMDDTPG